MKYSTLCTCVAVSATVAVEAFTITPLANPKIASKRGGNFNIRILHNAKKEGGEDDDERTGMDNAFKALGDISSLESLTADDFKSVPSSTLSSPLSLSSDLEELMAVSKEDLTPDEVNLYSDMYNELKGDDGAAVYGDILGELTGGDAAAAPSKSKPASSGTGFSKVIADADGIGSINNDIEQLTAVELSQDTDEFMRRALKEALEETDPITGAIAKKSSSSGKMVEQSILQDEEMMKEINAIFDRASDQLLEGIGEIKQEQAAMSAASAESRNKALEEEERKLKEAEGSVNRLVNKVKEETLEVEKAVEELKEAQKMLGDDPLMQAVDLKKGGLVRQGALVGALLFGVRSVGELIAMAGGGFGAEEHGTAAAVQGVIALACAAYLTLF